MGATLLRGLACGAAAVLLALPSVASADFTAQEGSSYSGDVVTIGGCGVTSASITWGDGTPNSAGTGDGLSIAGTHTYARAGTYNGSVSYTCSQFSGVQQASFVATVTDAALTSTGRGISGTAGQALHAVVAHFADANAGANAADFSAQINWGDGATSVGVVTKAGGGGFDVTGDHTYAAAGGYTVATSIA